MTQEQSNSVLNQDDADDVSPDSLMSDFRGRPIAAIVAFTVIVHVVVVGGFSVGYMKNAVFGEDTSAMSETERLDMAVRDATTSLREIAERYGISPQELSDRFAEGKTQSSITDSTKAAETPATAQQATSEASMTSSDQLGSQQPGSAIESELQIEAAGPQVPALPSLEEEDLFK
ncbi:MAG: hypothetical protein CBE00_11720 [Planctomycetaceae bacterium TMED240]|nr:MAG: hypothetical protein CBE00_11720 [Planctomycetaceae bacterium TMED240]